MLRRAKRFEEATAVAEEAAQALAELVGDHDAATTEIARSIGSLAQVEDDAAHSCSDPFTTEE